MDYSQIIVRVSYEDKNFEIIIAAQDSLEQLRHQIKSVLDTNNIFSNVNENSFRMRVGFPPVIIDSQTPGEKTLKELKIGNNDQIRLEHVDENVDKASIPSNAGNSKDSNDLIDYTKYSIKRKVIPADNSCLFNSVNYALNQNINEPFIMRSLIAAEIQSNLDLYNEAILDKNPNEYCEWIMDSSTWGGGIEISILSKSFQVAVAVVDILNCTIECFGENCSDVIYLLYDGIHYDVLVRHNENGLFLTLDESVRKQALEISKELNKARKFVDTKKYSIRCNVCYKSFTGNDEAVAHSKSTSHTNFVQLS